MSEKDEHYRLGSIFFTPCREALDRKEGSAGGNLNTSTIYLIKQDNRLLSLGEITRYNICTVTVQSDTCSAIFPGRKAIGLRQFYSHMIINFCNFNDFKERPELTHLSTTQPINQKEPRFGPQSDRTRLHLITTSWTKTNPQSILK